MFVNDDCEIFPGKRGNSIKIPQYWLVLQFDKFVLWIITSPLLWQIGEFPTPVWPKSEYEER